jgi:hypothetical protein
MDVFDPILFPPKIICPAVGWIRPSRQRPIVVFPEPDSPTSESVCPFSKVKLTPLTA